jgi:hypothetical protein
MCLSPHALGLRPNPVRDHIEQGTMRCEKHVQSPFQLVLVDLLVQILNIEPNTVLARYAHRTAETLTSGSAILRFDSLSL